MSLAHLREVHTQRHVRVPLVGPAGAHRADLSLDLRFFHSRNPGGSLLPPWRVGWGCCPWACCRPGLPVGLHPRLQSI